MLLQTTLIPLLLEAQGPDLQKRLTYAAVALLIALLIAWMVTGSWKSQLKSVRKEHSARYYVRKDSLVLHRQADIFSHKDLDKSPKPKKES